MDVKNPICEKDKAFQLANTSRPDMKSSENST